MKRRCRVIRLVFILFLYGLIVLYTLIFPTTASWFIFYAFTLWLLLSFLSTRQSYHLIRTEKLKKEDDTYHFIFTIANKRRQPFLLSSVTVTLLFNEVKRSSSTAVFFSKQIESQFHAISLPRGHYETLTLDIVGTGLFGVWKKHSQIPVPINIDVYPNVLKRSERNRLMDHLAPYLTDTAHSLHHDYYMADIRDFQYRDTLAGIDWKTSLKRGQWMVKEYESEEETPLALYFIGFDTEAFEDLLGLTYSLLQELRENQRVDLFLLGRFNGKPDLVQDKTGFLTIMPEQNGEDLRHLWQAAAHSPSKTLIFKPSQAPVSVSGPSADLNIYIDETIFPAIKGGASDSEPHDR